MGFVERITRGRSRPPRRPEPASDLNSLGRTYSYHAFPGSQVPDLGEAAPHINGERYNYDRMQLMVENVDFRGRSVLDVGCNSGWFCRQLATVGAEPVFGVDDARHPEMGEGLAYAQWEERRSPLGVEYVDFHCTGRNVEQLFHFLGVAAVDYALVLSVLHHVPEPSQFMAALGARVTQGIVYEDASFWNRMHDDAGALLPAIEDGHRFGWDADLSWRRRIGSIASHEDEVIAHFTKPENADRLGLHSFVGIRFLGFSEKRRPLLLLTTD